MNLIARRAQWEVNLKEVYRRRYITFARWRGNKRWFLPILFLYLIFSNVSGNVVYRPALRGSDATHARRIWIRNASRGLPKRILRWPEKYLKHGIITSRRWPPAYTIFGLEGEPSATGNDDVSKEYRKRTGESPREKLGGRWRGVRSGDAIWWWPSYPLQFDMKVDLWVLGQKSSWAMFHLLGGKKKLEIDIQYSA